jgi:hypothetical protein
MRNLRRPHSLPVLRQKSNKLGTLSEAFSDLQIFRAVGTEIHCIPSRLPEVILAFAQGGVLISCATTISFLLSKRRVE